MEVGTAQPWPDDQEVDLDFIFGLQNSSDLSSLLELCPSHALPMEPSFLGPCEALPRHEDDCPQDVFQVKDSTSGRPLPISARKPSKPATGSSEADEDSGGSSHSSGGVRHSCLKGTHKKTTPLVRTQP